MLGKYRIFLGKDTIKTAKQHNHYFKHYFNYKTTKKNTPVKKPSL